MSCLRNTSTDELALGGFTTRIDLASAPFPFAPILDGRYPSFSTSSSIFDWLAFFGTTNVTEDIVFAFLAGQWPGLTRGTFDNATSGFYPSDSFAGNFSWQERQIYGEIRYMCPALFVVGALCDAGMPAFEYHWDHPTLSSDHGSELAMFAIDTADQVSDPLDEQLATAMRAYWTSLATDGRPYGRWSAPTAACVCCSTLGS
ncbi:hypothetical protein DFH09DRAFT_1314734 [Mycena vulgaris]|nr:hypothetical protein DFH09DRAFT_1314734 [Mycena vulgaris]